MYHPIYKLLTTITHMYLRTVIPLGGITIKAPVQKSSFIKPENLSTSLKYVPQEKDLKHVLRCFSESGQHGRKVYLKI